MSILTLKRSRYSAAEKDSKGARLASYYDYSAYEKRFSWALLLLLCRRHPQCHHGRLVAQRQFPLPAVDGLRHRRFPWPCTSSLHRHRHHRGIRSRCCYRGGFGGGRGGVDGVAGDRCTPLHPVRAPLPPLLYRHNATPPPSPPPPFPPPPLPLPRQQQLPALQAYPRREPAVARAAPSAVSPPFP